MNEQVQEFLKQLNNEIKRLEGRIQEYKQELAKDIDGQFYTIEEFGLSKYAEQVTKIAGQLKILYNQRYNFLAIFNIKE